MMVRGMFGSPVKALKWWIIFLIIVPIFAGLDGCTSAVTSFSPSPETVDSMILWCSGSFMFSVISVIFIGIIALYYLSKIRRVLPDGYN